MLPLRLRQSWQTKIEVLTRVEEEGNNEVRKGLESLWKAQGKVGNALGTLNFTLEARVEEMCGCEKDEWCWA